jgi:hypothetical protein
VVRRRRSAPVRGSAGSDTSRVAGGALYRRTIPLRILLSPGLTGTRTRKPNIAVTWVTWPNELKECETTARE